MNVRDALVKRLTDRIVRMRTAFEQFDDATAERAMVGPKYNVRDLVGHFVFWNQEAAQQLGALMKGGKPKGYDLDRVNEDVHRKYRRMSHVMLLPQLRAADERLVEVLRQVKPEVLIGDTPVRDWVDTILSHYDDHWPGIKAAL
jgi:hypothetical protein